MKRTVVLVLASLLLTFGTGINGCGNPPLLDLEVVVPPGATRIEDALVVIVDSKGDTAVITWEDFRRMDLTDYHTIEEVRAAATSHVP